MTYITGTNDPVFLDTNILVYAYDSQAGKKHIAAEALLKKCWQDRSGSVSIQVLQEFYVTVTRKIANPLTWNDARQVIQDLNAWQIFIPGTQDILRTIDLQQRYQISYWDAAVIEIALRGGCKILYSEDLNHGQFFGKMQIINPLI